jgi:hypothetical protein
MFTNAFLGHKFIDYGWKYFEYLYNHSSGMSNPVAAIFPITSKCSIPMYSVSGNDDYVEAQCVLPLNILNEKIYLVLWVWFAVLGIMTTFEMFNRLLYLISPRYRSRSLRNFFYNDLVFVKVFGSMSCGGVFLLEKLPDFLEAKLMKDIVFAIGVKVFGGKEMASEKC